MRAEGQGGTGERKSLTDAEIQRSIGWLLANGSPAVRYLSCKNLVGADPRSTAMKRLWAEVEACPDATEVFSKQKPDGSWFAGGSWANAPSYTHRGGEPYNAISPKYVTTMWVLPILGDMGFDTSDKRVMKGFDHALAYFAGPWMKGLHEPNPRNNPCHLAVSLAAMGRVGVSKDARLAKYWDLLLRWQRKDGGWVREDHLDATCSPYVVWARSCPWVTHFAATALCSSGMPEHRAALRKALGFLAANLSIKTRDEIQHIFYHGHNTVKELLMFSETGVGIREPAVRIALEWLMGMYREEEGCFRYQGKPISKHTRRQDGSQPRVLKYRLYHVVEDDWLTYHMTRIARNCATFRA